MNKINIVIPMLGLGQRFKDNTDVPKPLIEVDGKTLIEHSIESLNIKGKYIFITRNYDNQKYNKKLTDIFDKLCTDYVEIKSDKLTSGPAETCLLAVEHIDQDNPLIITNCDQLMKWDSKEFLEKIKNSDVDGAVVTYESDSIKDSYAKVVNEKIVQIAEKQVISNEALTGVHYWKHGKDFVRSANKALEDISLRYKERYISETYSYLIDEGKNLITHKIPVNEYICLGTPEHVDQYLGKIKEFYTEKPKTIFCDIDGTIIKHVHRFSEVGKIPAELLPGVKEKFNEWDSKGYKVILTTARKESARRLTEKQLASLGLSWDYLLMGMTSGQRILINDKLIEKDPDRAISVNLITGSGFINEEIHSV